MESLVISLHKFTAKYDSERVVKIGYHLAKIWTRV